MLIRKLSLVAAIFGVIGVGSGVASAATHITLNPGGATPAVGSTITNTSSDPAVMTFTGLGVITCNSTKLTATLTSASSAGPVAAHMDALTFTNCTDTIPVINYASCAKASTSVPTVTITGTSSAGGVLTLGNTSVRCAIVGSRQGCYFRAATAVGTATNTPSAISYNNVAVTHTAQGATDDLGAACGSTTSLSFTLTHIVNASNLTVTIRG